MLPASVHRTVVNAFDAQLLKLLRPGQWLEFKQCH